MQNNMIHNMHDISAEANIQNMQKDMQNMQNNMNENMQNMQNNMLSNMDQYTKRYA
jgi:hypothetical protein